MTDLKTLYEEDTVAWAENQAAAHTASAAINKTTRFLLDIFLHPIDMPLHNIHQEFGLVRTMVLARINHHLGQHTAMLERVVVFVAL